MPVPHELNVRGRRIADDEPAYVLAEIGHNHQGVLEKGAQVNVSDTESGATPLHVAASWGREDAVVVLLARGATVNARNKAGSSPLAAAIMNSHTQTADILRRSGAKE